MKKPAALGFRAHSGWAVVVAVAGEDVLERRRIVIAEAAIAGSKQPYHAAEKLDLRAADALIRRCRERSVALAAGEIGALAAGLAGKYRLVGSGLVCGSGRPLPHLAAILRSHAMIHTAEGEFFRQVLASACEGCSMSVKPVKEREVWERAAAASHVELPALQQRISALGRTLGPPWTQDEKLAAMAGWIALAEGV